MLQKLSWNMEEGIWFTKCYRNCPEMWTKAYGSIPKCYRSCPEMWTKAYGSLSVTEVVLKRRRKHVVHKVVMLQKLSWVMWTKAVFIDCFQSCSASFSQWKTYGENTPEGIQNTTPNPAHLSPPPLSLLPSFATYNCYVYSLFCFIILLYVVIIKQCYTCCPPWL